jgi:microcin C transport system permease protein
MGAYLVRRVLLIFPTLFGIMLINFAVIQIVPGGPVEQMIAQMTGTAVESTARFSGGGEGELNSSFDASSFDDGDSKYRGAQGLDPDIIKEIEVMYGMDKPAHERFFKMLKSYIFFDFGESFFRDQKVTSLVLDKMPVSISLGLWTTLLVYLISIPLGIRKAIKDGSRFDIISSSIVTIGYAIPNFLFAVILIVFFAGGRFYDIFPLRGLVSENFEELTLLAQIKDYFWHFNSAFTCNDCEWFCWFNFFN